MIESLRQRCTLKEPLHELFKLGEILEITNGSFKGLFGFMKSYKRFQMLYQEPCY
jgi:hypothetical protein